MELENLKNFDRARETWNKFWRGDLNRPIIHAVVPKKNIEPAPKPTRGAAFYTDHERLADQVLQWAESFDWLADSVPFYSPNICMGQFSAMLGAKIQTVREQWGIDTHPIAFLKNLDPELVNLDRTSQMWEKFIHMLDVFSRKLSGKVVFGEISLEWNLDFLAGIRGTVQTMTDFYDNPAGVHAVMKRLTEINQEITDELIERCDINTWGSITRHGLYSTSITGVPQCDFGFNIGTDHFREFALPYLCRECNMLDDIEYHLDGPNNIPHLESICTIDKIKVIQWVPGAGDAKDMDWSNLYKKINALGRGLMLYCHTDEVMDLWKAYSSSRAKRLMLYVHTDNAGEIQRLMDSLESL